MKEPDRQFFCDNWRERLNKLFPQAIPTTASWTGLNEIVHTLNAISGESLNHTFYPTGGGNDLMGAKRSTESGCLELGLCGCTIVRPQVLTFYSFGDDCLEWSYFRLETGGLELTGIYEPREDLEYEEVLELTPDHYIDRSAFDCGFYTDENGAEVRIPETARVISRFTSGAFVVFCKGSPYNWMSGKRFGDTYDGRHNKMTADAFRQYIESLVRQLVD